MRSILTVTAATEDRQLLSIEEMRAAAGLEDDDSSQDDVLEAMGLRVADSIMAECNIVVGGGSIYPTLWRETLSESFWRLRDHNLMLSRRHAIEISSIVADDETLGEGDFEVDPESGIVMRLCGDEPIRWCATRVVVTYDAGFEELPDDLRSAALEFFRLMWREDDRDPALKTEEIDIPGVRNVRRDYWVGSVPGQSSEGAVPAIVAGQLKRYRNLVIG